MELKVAKTKAKTNPATPAIVNKTVTGTLTVTMCGIGMPSFGIPSVDTRDNVEKIFITSLQARTVPV